LEKLQCGLLCWARGARDDSREEDEMGEREKEGYVVKW